MGHRLAPLLRSSTSLADHRKLRPGKGVLGIELGDPFRVCDRIVAPPQLLQVHRQRRMRQDVIGVVDQDLLQFGNRRLKISGDSGLITKH